MPEHRSPTTTTAASPIRIALITSDPISRAAFAALVVPWTDMKLLPDARRSGCDLLVVVERAVDGVLLGTLRSHARDATVPVCAIVDEPGDETLLTAGAHAGLSGLVLRDEATPDLLAGVLRRVHGSTARCDGPDGRLQALQSDRERHRHLKPPTGLDLSDLDKREAMILRLLADGLSTSEIASVMGYSEPTIKSSLSCVLQRHDLRNRIHAVSAALQQGLI
ncbi:response regulator transcription factor [Kineosporia sp. J2-2]|uniref:Response regulator transcription factor n=1 Tax=Kineosporia corallincola TaxID=2835133 RepID=A0ABS5TGP4_9ACTN|nr:LuxR C-terminal-related transcriptional regulator [Kineosporia corallincola]MBT0770215.1 response regulator transcription factor [Kineosporia corallincola]